jgi:hypothetical protein
MLEFLRLLVQLAKFYQHLGAVMSLALIYWWNFASCTISIGANIWPKMTQVLVL